MFASYAATCTYFLPNWVNSIHPAELVRFCVLKTTHKCFFSTSTFYGLLLYLNKNNKLLQRGINYAPRRLLNRKAFMCIESCKQNLVAVVRTELYNYQKPRGSTNLKTKVIICQFLMTNIDAIDAKGFLTMSNLKILPET